MLESFFLHLKLFPASVPQEHPQYKSALMHILHYRFESFCQTSQCPWAACGCLGTAVLEVSFPQWSDKVGPASGQCLVKSLSANKAIFFFFDCVCSMLITKAILLFFLCHFFLYDIMYMPDTKMCRKVNKWKYLAEFLCMVIIHVEMQFLADQNIDSFKLETANRIW